MANRTLTQATGGFPVGYPTQRNGTPAKPNSLAAIRWRLQQERESRPEPSIDVNFTPYRDTEIRGKLDALGELDLDPYRKRTSVVLRPHEKQLQGLLSNMLTGEQTQFRNLLEGEPDQGALQRVFNAQERSFDRNVVPSIRSAGAMGNVGGQTSGALQRQQLDAETQMFEQQAMIRYQAEIDAKQLGLQATSLLPAFA